MTQLLVLREYIKNFISKNETYVRPVGKFLIAMISLILINSKIGYAGKLNNFAFTVILSLVCSFLPTNFIVLLCAGMMILHLYSLSLECVIVVGIMLVLMFLLYFRFSPSDTLLLLLTPVCFALKVPYVIPISAGLVTGVSSVVSVGCGVALYYILAFINGNVETIRAMSDEDMISRLRFLVDELLFNKEMLMLIIGFAVTIVVVNVVRRLSVDHAWTIAIVMGTLCDIVVVLVGDLKFGTYISVLGLIFGSVVAVMVVTVIKFFFFHVDYKKTENVQFEDDEYYYYVKAVPKITLKDRPRHKNHEKAHDKRSEQSHRRSYDKRYDDSYEKASNREKKRIIHEDEELVNNRIVKSEKNLRRTDSRGMTEIERAAAAKARAKRNRQGK